MISLYNLFEDIQQPPPRPGQMIPTQQQMDTNTNTPSTEQKPGLWNSIKSGYNSINQKYENFMDKVGDIAFSSPMRALAYAGGSLGTAALTGQPMYGVLGAQAAGIGFNALAQRHAQEKYEKMMTQQPQQPQVPPQLPQQQMMLQRR